MSSSLIIFISIFLLLIKNDKNFNHAYGLLISDISISKLITNNKDALPEQNVEKKIIEDGTGEGIPQSVPFLRHSGYNRIYNTSIIMWKEQPLTGFGLKSFRVKCWNMLNKDNAERKITQKPQYIACAQLLP